MIKLKKTLQTNIEMNDLYDTRLCGYNTVYCHTNHSSQCWFEVFFYLLKFLLLSLVFAYIYISQGSVEMHSPCGGIYNNQIIANCLQSVPVRKFLKWSITGEDMNKSKVARFLAHGVYFSLSCSTSSTSAFRSVCRQSEYRVPISLLHQPTRSFVHWSMNLHMLPYCCYTAAVVADGDNELRGEANNWLAADGISR